MATGESRLTIHMVASLVLETVKVPRNEMAKEVWCDLDDEVTKAGVLLGGGLGCFGVIVQTLLQRKARASIEK